MVSEVTVHIVGNKKLVVYTIKTVQHMWAFGVEDSFSGVRKSVMEGLKMSRRKKRVVSCLKLDRFDPFTQITVLEAI